MDAFLFSLIAAALAGWGERAQLLTARTAARTGQGGSALAGFTLAAMAICAVAGIGGALLHGAIAPRALTLLVALALAYSGIVGLFEPPPPGWAERFKGGPFLTAALFGFVFSSGGRAQVTTFAIAAQTGLPLLAAIGGAAGMILAAAPAAALGEEYLRWRVRPARIGIAILFLVAAAMVALAAR